MSWTKLGAALAAATIAAGCSSSGGPTPAPERDPDLADVASGDPVDGAGTGPTATVEADGSLAARVPPRSMLAIHTCAVVE